MARAPEGTLKSSALAPIAPWMGPPHPPRCNWRAFPQAPALPSPPSPSLFPPTTPLALFFRWEGAAQAGVGEGSYGAEGLGPDPHLGLLKIRACTCYARLSHTLGSTCMRIVDLNLAMPFRPRLSTTKNVITDQRVLIRQRFATK